MTCVVGLVHEEVVYIGADSAGVSGWDLTLRADSKVFRNDGYLMGFTTSFRMGQILHHSFDPPAQGEDTEISKHMATVFVDSVRTILKAGGFAKKDNEVETGGIFLVGYRGRLFEIESDYQVGEPLDEYAAIGCGAQIAHGSLYSTIGQAPDARVMLALQAAEHFSNGVRGPFKILSM